MEKLSSQRDKDSVYRRLQELREELTLVSPAELARRTGALLCSIGDTKKGLRLPFWNSEIIIYLPGFAAYYEENHKELDVFSQLLLAYYFAISDGALETGHWISFSELPDGKFYVRAFQGYTGKELEKFFEDDVEKFAKASRSVRGSFVEFGDRAYSFNVLPNVTLMAVCWLGDSDFPTSYRVLFDSAVGNHLSTDGCAILGSALTRKLIKAVVEES